MRKGRRRPEIPIKTSVGCLMVQAADDKPKDATGSLNILSMIRDTTVRFQRLRRVGVKISSLKCGL